MADNSRKLDFTGGNGRILILSNLKKRSGKEITMMQKIKQFQYKMQKNRRFCIGMTLSGILFPCIYFATYYLSISLLGNLLWIGFYGILGNIFLFHQNKVLRLILLMINIVILLSIYLCSLIAGWYGIFSVLLASFIPFCGFWLNLFFPSYFFVL